MRRIHAVKIDTPEYYDTLVWPPEVNERPYYDATRMRELLRRVKAGDRVADLGAGCFGAAQYAVEKDYLDAHFVAVDSSKAAAKLVMERIGARRDRFEYIVADCAHSPLETASFEVVMSGEVIEHFEDPRELAAEMARLTKPGGWMNLSTVNDQCPNALQREYPEHLWAFEPEDLVGFFRPYGEARYYLFGDYHMIECQRAK